MKLRVVVSWLVANFWLVFCILTHGAHGCHSNSTTVGVCLHIYLERDFPAIEGFIYPNTRPMGASTTRKPIILSGGEELNNTHNRIGDVVKCLEDLQASCHYYAEFFPYRRMVTSIRKTHTWLGQDLQKRFGTLLSNFRCFEEVRFNVSTNHRCFQRQVPKNIWQKILRMEIGEDVCPYLRAQLTCLDKMGYIRQKCDNQDVSTLYGNQDVSTLYGNVIQQFLNAWCSHTSRLLPFSFIFLTIQSFVMIFLGTKLTL